MSGIPNGSFETGTGSQGVAASWSWFTTTTAARIAVYNDSRFEGFELGWNADVFVSSLIVPTNANQAIYDTGDVPATYDNFERKWYGNESFVDTLSSAASAQYGSIPDVFDGFERQWSSNESFAFALSGAVAALYAGGADAFDGFERQWSSNESFAFSVGSVSMAAAIYTEGGTTGNAETFEAAFPDQSFSTNPSTSVFTTQAPHGMANDDIVHVYNDGTGQLPTGLSKDLEYTVVISTSTSFQLLIGPDFQLVTDVGSGTNYVTENPTKYWTLSL